MAQDISKLNIEVTGTTAPLDASIDKTTKKLADIAPSTAPIDNFVNKTKAGIAAIDREIATRLSPRLAALKAEASKGIVGKDFLAGGALQDIEKLKGELDKGGSEREGALAKGIKKKFLDIPGFGKIGDGLGEAGLGIGGLLAVGEIASTVRESERTSGQAGFHLRHGGSATNAVLGGIYGLQQLPVLKQASEAAGELGAVFGMKTSTSDNAAELERLNSSAELYAKLRNEAAESAKANARADEQNARTLESIKNQGIGRTLGGRDLQAFNVDTSAREQIAGVFVDRDKKNEAAKAEIKRLNEEFAKDSVNVKNTAQGRAGTKEGDDAKKELDRLTQAKNDAIAEQKKAIASNNQAAGDQASALAANAQAQLDIIHKVAPDIAKQQDLYEGLGDTIDTLGKDQFDTLRKQFLETKPDADAIARYSKRVDQLKEAIGAVTSGQQIKELGQQLAVEKAGDDPLARIHAEIQARDDLNQKQKDAREIAAKALQVQRQLNDFAKEERSIAAQLAVAKAGIDPIAALRAEINARRDLNAQQKEQLFQDRKALLLQSEGNSIKESVKTPEEHLKDELDKIKRNLAVNGGQLDDKSAQLAIIGARNAFLDTQRVANPRALVFNSAEDQRSNYINAGRAQDSNNPQLREMKKTNQLLEDIKNGRSTQDIADDI